MKNLLFIFVFIYTVNCTINTNKSVENLSQRKIDLSKAYSFNEYINLLSENNKFKEYPNINDFPD